jgi:chromate transporter
VLVLLACGVLELGLQARGVIGRAAVAVVVPSHSALGPLAWTAVKVGLLSFGGGFVIVPLMQGDAVHVNHWMTQTHFLNAVALGQVTPGPVVATIAAVGYAAHGVGGGVLAALIAFTPSFAFVLVGGRWFGALRGNPRAQAFLAGAGPAAIGAIVGSAVPLGLALQVWWQGVLLGLAGAALLAPGSRFGVVSTLVGAGAAGAVLALLGAPLG